MPTLTLKDVLILDIFRMYAYADQNGSTHAFFLGDLDMSTAGAMTSFLRREIDANPTTINCNLSQLSFMDGFGLRALVGCRREAAQQRCALDLVLGSNTMLQRLFALFAVKPLFSVA